jgi:hypothetical protein
MGSAYVYCHGQAGASKPSSRRNSVYKSTSCVKQRTTTKKLRKTSTTWGLASPRSKQTFGFWEINGTTYLPHGIPTKVGPIQNKPVRKPPHHTLHRLSQRARSTFHVQRNTRAPRLRKGQVSHPNLVQAHPLGHQKTLQKAQRTSKGTNLAEPEWWRSVYGQAETRLRPRTRPHTHRRYPQKESTKHKPWGYQEGKVFFLSNLRPNQGLTTGNDSPYTWPSWLLLKHHAGTYKLMAQLSTTKPLITHPRLEKRKNCIGRPFPLLTHGCCAHAIYKSTNHQAPLPTRAPLLCPPPNHTAQKHACLFVASMEADPGECDPTRTRLPGTGLAGPHGFHDSTEVDSDDLIEALFGLQEGTNDDVCSINSSPPQSPHAHTSPDLTMRLPDTPYCWKSHMAILQFLGPCPFASVGLEGDCGWAAIRTYLNMVKGGPPRTTRTMGRRLRNSSIFLGVGLVP